MQIIEIKALENGAHRNQNGFIGDIPDGWAVIPDDIETQSFPSGEVTVSELDGVMTVTSWIPGTIPEPEPVPEHEPTLEDRVAVLETDAAQAALDRAALKLLLTGEDTEATT